MEQVTHLEIGLPEDLPVWEEIQPTNDGLAAVGLSKKQIKKVWRREGDVLVEVPKKDGSIRECSGPNGSQKMLSMALLVHLMKVHEAGTPMWSEIAFGFVPGHGNIDAAQAVEDWMKSGGHLERSVAYSDLKGAFGAVSVKQVRQVLLRAGLTGWHLELAVRLTTRPDESGRMVLTTGNPVSPLILNAACLELDKRLQKVAAGREGIAVRYADDIVITGVGRKSRSLRRQLLQAITEAGFTPHPKKQGHATSSNRRKSRGYLCVEVVGVQVERSAYRSTHAGAGYRLRKVTPHRFRQRLRAAIHQDREGTARQIKGMRQYNRAVRTWKRPKPKIDWDKSIAMQQIRHQALLSRRLRRRRLASA